MREYLIAAAVFGQDALTKQIVREKVGKREERPLAGGKVILTKVYNDGAALGLLKKHPAILKNMTLLSVGSLFGALAVMKREGGHKTRRLGLALMLGGAASNAYERFLYGEVTDYIRFEAGPGKFSRLVFNTGDFAVVIGSILAAFGK